MQLDILTPQKKLYSGEVTAVQLPGTNGLFQVLNNHAPLISSLGEGTIKIDAEGGSQTFAINSGFAEVLNNEVSVLVEGATAE